MKPLIKKKWGLKSNDFLRLTDTPIGKFGEVYMSKKEQPTPTLYSFTLGIACMLLLHVLPTYLIWNYTLVSILPVKQATFIDISLLCVVVRIFSYWHNLSTKQVN